MPGMSVASVLYDGDCGLCRRCVDALLAWDRRGAIEAIPLRSARAGELLPELDSRQRLASWHFAAPDGTVSSAGAAAAPLLELLPGGRPLARVLRRFPSAAEAGYRAIVRVRSLTGCSGAGGSCRNGQTRV